MELDKRWLTQIGIDAQTGIGYTGGEDKFVSALQRYYRSFEKNREKIQESYDAKDYENFMITVHALKSNSKMIGAGPLSIEFEKLEMAARSGDVATIESLTGPAVAAYTELIEKLAPVGQMGEVRAAGELTADEAGEVAERLLAALDDFDDELSKELVRKLSGYPFRITQREQLKEAAGYIDDFMYDEAAGIISQISGTIE